jgi:4-alpha-glucanotransferase
LSRFNFTGRSSGILLHLTSLPGIHGAGDLGPEAFRFLEFLERAGQSWWQMLPVGPPGSPPAFSPYDSCSGFAGNPYFVSLTILEKEGLLNPNDTYPPKEFSHSRVNFTSVHEYREGKLRKAYYNFLGNGSNLNDDYNRFCDLNAYWLDDFALFMALRIDSGGKGWTGWKEEIRSRRADALEEVRHRLADEIGYHRFIQFMFDRQWGALHGKSTLLGIGLIGDLPIFVAHDSADVWSNQELFHLDRRGLPSKVSGYPPDRFNADGQRWGHPQYNWARHRATDFDWWIKRFSHMYKMFDAIRIDHFLGFTRTWSIPANSEGAGKGSWVKSPGSELFSVVTKKLGPHPLIAEDLGRVTPADISLRDAFGMLPMRIFQFGFGKEADSGDHLPHNYKPLTAAYTGNHDNNTFKGWFSSLSPLRKRLVRAYTGSQAAPIHWDTLRTLSCSAANLVIFPLQDILGLGTRSRMNTPGTIDGNWNWRLNTKIPDITVKRLRMQTKLFGRI